MNDSILSKLFAIADRVGDSEDDLLAMLNITRLAKERSLPLDWPTLRREFYGYEPGEPFSLVFDTSKSLRFIVEDLLSQAVKRQKEATGTMYAGAVLQHLVGAKLSLMLGEEAIASHGFSVADTSSKRAGDFLIEDVSIHVTTAPSESLMAKCLENLKSGLRPVIVTTSHSLAGALSLAEIKGIGSRIDIIEASQFIAMNLYEWSKFKPANRKVTVDSLVERYNAIVAVCETDPGLKIAIAK